MALPTLYKVQDLLEFTLAADFLAADTQMSVNEDLTAVNVPLFLSIEDPTNGNEVILVEGKDTSATPHKFTSITRAKSGSAADHLASNSQIKIASAPTEHILNPIVDHLGARVQQTASDTTIYVDAVNGSDTTGDGTSSNPFKTIEAAVASLPSYIAHNVIIALNTGAYSPTSTLTFAGLTIEGSLALEAMDLNGNPLHDSGTATGGTSTTLQDTSKSWTTNFWVNAYVAILNGTGAGQIRQVVSNTADTLTVDSAWTTTPDSTSKYIIFGLARINGANLGATTNLMQIANRAVNFRGIDFYDYYRIYGSERASMGFTNCAFRNLNGASNFPQYPLMFYNQSSGSVSNCYVSGDVIGIYINFLSKPFVGGCYITGKDGNEKGIRIYNLSTISLGAASYNTFANLNQGIELAGNSVALNTTYQVFNNVTTPVTPDSASSSDGSYSDYV